MAHVPWRQIIVSLAGGEAAPNIKRAFGRVVGRRRRPRHRDGGSGGEIVGIRHGNGNGLHTRIEPTLIWDSRVVALEDGIH